MRSRYQKRRVSIGGETDATDPGHADRRRVEMDGIEIESSEWLQLERLPEVLTRTVVALDKWGDPGDDRNVDIRRALIAGPGSVPGQAAVDRFLPDNDRAFADGLAHRRLVDDVVGAGNAEIELDNWLIDLFRQLSSHDGGD